MSGTDCSGVVCYSTGQKTHSWFTKDGMPPGSWSEVSVNATSKSSFYSKVKSRDLFLWYEKGKINHTAFYSGGSKLFHAHGAIGTPTGFTSDLNWYLKTFTYPRVFRQVAP